MDVAEQLAEALRQAQEHLASIGYPADANGKYDKDGEWDFLESVPSRTDAREVLQAFNTIGAALDAYESTKGRDEPVAFEERTRLYGESEWSAWRRTSRAYLDRYKNIDSDTYQVRGLYTHPATQGPSAECWRKAMKKYAELPWGLRIGLGINGIAWIEQRAKELAEEQE